jgi:hypothetical protein
MCKQNICSVLLHAGEGKDDLQRCSMLADWPEPSGVLNHKVGITSAPCADCCLQVVAKTPLRDYAVAQLQELLAATGDQQSVSSSASNEGIHNHCASCSPYSSTCKSNFTNSLCGTCLL